MYPHAHPSRATRATAPAAPAALLLPLLLLALAAAAPAPAQYYLFSPLGVGESLLIDRDGNTVHRWPTALSAGNSTYILPNGNLLRPGFIADGPFQQGGSGGVVQEIGPFGEVVWHFNYIDENVCQHHDIEPLPNGNVLVLAWERKTAAEAIAAGRDPKNLADDMLWPEHILEVRPTPPLGGEIVWEWHVWDHLVQDLDETKANFGDVARQPERVDINFGNTTQQRAADWLHANSIAYNAEFDQIAISVRTFNEIWVIDHSTTTEEAVGSTGGRYGRGGDLLYRWGNPQAYRRGTEEDRIFYSQHDVRWVEAGLPGAGNLTVFNNGVGRPGGDYSTADEFAPPVDERGFYEDPGDAAFGPSRQEWTYVADPPESFYSQFVGGVTRLASGDTLICDGYPDGRFFEVTTDGEVRWEYTSGSFAFRVTRLEEDDPAVLALFRARQRQAFLVY